jgi:ribosomal protein S18 acetylase RimI-like enzyme
MATVRELHLSDLKDLQQFCDVQIGHGYYQFDELRDIYQKYLQGPHNPSFVLLDRKTIVGLRLSYPPGLWTHGKGRGITPSKWPHQLEHTAYFQSLFIASGYRQQGWGRVLSQSSLQVLRRLGARGVVCHAWKESPNNSSLSYLEKMGFIFIAEHPRYWSQVNYRCTRCQTQCECTAHEMYLNLKDDQ